MNKKQYHDTAYTNLVRHVLDRGVHKSDRTGTGTISTFGYQMRFDLSDGTIPLLTTKKMHIRSIIYELLWYLQGASNIKYLRDNDVTIWDEWADENGDLGPVYGVQWRKWRSEPRCSINYNTDPTKAEIEWSHIDQIADVIQRIKTNPDDRRMIVSAWNVGEIKQMRLPPCHLLFQFYVVDGKLSCQLYQRSCDVGLGVPFNIVQYSILTRMIAHVTGLTAHEFIWTGGDVHVYLNHIEQLKEQIIRKPYPSPKLKLNPLVNEINDFTYYDFHIVEYEHHPAIKMDVSI
jgi:thymidylate synthase